MTVSRLQIEKENYSFDTLFPINLGYAGVNLSELKQIHLRRRTELLDGQLRHRQRPQDCEVSVVLNCRPIHAVTGSTATGRKKVVRPSPSRIALTANARPATVGTHQRVPRRNHRRSTEIPHLSWGEVSVARSH